MLDSNVFLQLAKLWSKPTMDLFASRLNCQISKFTSWKPDPDAVVIDAFSIPWSNEYHFPGICAADSQIFLSQHQFQISLDNEFKSSDLIPPILLIWATALVLSVSICTCKLLLSLHRALLDSNVFLQ
jgi:hypothetical protein